MGQDTSLFRRDHVREAAKLPRRYRELSSSSTSLSRVNRLLILLFIIYSIVIIIVIIIINIYICIYITSVDNSSLSLKTCYLELRRPATFLFRFFFSHFLSFFLSLSLFISFSRARAVPFIIFLKFFVHRLLENVPTPSSTKAGATAAVSISCSPIFRFSF